MDLSVLAESEFLIKTVIVGFVVIVAGVMMKAKLGSPLKTTNEKKR